MSLSLRNLFDYNRYTVRSHGEYVGRLVDFFIDPETLALKGLSVDASHWVSIDKGAILLKDIKNVDFSSHVIEVAVSREEVIDEARDPEFICGSHLLRAKRLIGYGVRADDGEVGNVSDLISNHGRVESFVVDLHPIWPGDQVLLPVRLVTAVSKHLKQIEVSAKADDIRFGPRFDPSHIAAEDFQRHPIDYYGRSPSL